MPLSSGKKAVVLLSGGLDSAVVFKTAINKGEVILALTLNYGQRAAEKEFTAASAMANRFGVNLEVVNLPWLKNITKTALVDRCGELPEPGINDLDDLEKSARSARNVWVPNRNGVFINIAASYCEALGAEFVVAGFNAEEAATFPDNSPAFISAANEALSYSTLSKVQVVSPTSDMNKRDIVRLGMEIGAPLDLVWSCYEGGENMCGNCESCMRLKRALLDADSPLAGTLFT